MDEMEIEVPNSNPNKRFGIKNSIQTNFGDDYVFQIVPKDDWTSMAVSLSTNAIKLYSLATRQYITQCSGHSSTINHISFSSPSSPHVLYSCSDATLRAWDTRSFQQVFSVSADPSQEIFSFSFGGASQNLLAAGCNSQLLFWDWRNKRQGMHSCIISVVSRKCKGFGRKKLDFPLLGEVSVLSLVVLIICVAFAIFWAATRKVSYSWIGQDILGICLMITVLQLAQLPNIKVATVLLSCAFLYDIFWVFLSPAIFHDSVMIAVARGDKAGGESMNKPLKYFSYAICTSCS